MIATADRKQNKPNTVFFNAGPCTVQPVDGKTPLRGKDSLFVDFLKMRIKVDKQARPAGTAGFFVSGCG